MKMQKKIAKYTFSVVLTNFKKSGLIQPASPVPIIDKGKKTPHQKKVRLSIILVISICPKNFNSKICSQNRDKYAVFKKKLLRYI